MSDQKRETNWIGYAGVMAVATAGALIAAAATDLWVLTAVPVGLLFGFFLQKGDLCGASAFSEVLLMKDWRKVVGLWVCIVVSMLGFALFEQLGWVKLNPKPMFWLSYLVGGIVFGVGMVLAGGCVSGCLYKAGAGNLNSMAGVVGIPIGVAMVEYGPLNGWHKAMMEFVVRTQDKGSVTFSSVTGMPFWLIALILAGVTFGVGLILRLRMSRTSPKRGTSSASTVGEWLTRRTWRPWQAGLAIGILAAPAYVSSAVSGRNYGLGVTHGVLQFEVLGTERNVVHVYQKPKAAGGPASSTLPAAVGKPGASTAAPAPAGKKVVWWLVIVVVALVIGSWISGRLSGETRLLPKPPEQTAIAFIGGILVGTGAGFATGCVIGNIMTGWALMSVGLLIFGIATVLANWATTYVYLMGGRVIPR